MNKEVRIFSQWPFKVLQREMQIKLQKAKTPLHTLQGEACSGLASKPVTNQAGLWACVWQPLSDFNILTDQKFYDFITKGISSYFCPLPLGGSGRSSKEQQSRSKQKKEEGAN